MNGLFQAGAFFGSFGINVVGDRFGRKMSIIIPSLLVLVSGACLAGSVNVGMFIAFRFFSGMGSWWLLGSVPVWMSEVAPPKNRGVLVDCHSAALLFGYCAASWVGAGFYFYHPAANNQWRAPLGFQCLPVFIVLCFMHWLPESPRWLLQNDRTEEAERVLLKLHDSDEAALELQQIRNQIAVDNTLENSWMSLVTKRSYRKRTFITLGLSVGIQMTGVLVINSKRTPEHPQLLRRTKLINSRLRPDHLCKSRFKHKPTTFVPRWFQYTWFWLWNFGPPSGRQIFQTHAHCRRYRHCSCNLGRRSRSSSFVPASSWPEPSWTQGCSSDDLPLYRKSSLEEH